MASKKKTSQILNTIFDQKENVTAEKFIKKLLQYRMKYEEITSVILTHSDRAFLDGRLAVLEDYIQNNPHIKKSEVTEFLEELSVDELMKIVKKSELPSA